MCSKHPQLLRPPQHLDVEFKVQRIPTSRGFFPDQSQGGRSRASRMHTLTFREWLSFEGTDTSNIILLEISHQLSDLGLFFKHTYLYLRVMNPPVLTVSMPNFLTWF